MIEKILALVRSAVLSDGTTLGALADSGAVPEFNDRAIREVARSVLISRNASLREIGKKDDWSADRYAEALVQGLRANPQFGHLATAKIPPAKTPTFSDLRTVATNHPVGRLSSQKLQNLPAQMLGNIGARGETEGPVIEVPGMKRPEPKGFVPTAQYLGRS